MEKEKDQKIQPTENQFNPYLCRPEDWTVMRADEAAQKKTPGHGQRGDGLREYNRLLKASKPGRPDWQGKGEELTQRLGE